jgi:hypothetical protein
MVGENILMDNEQRWKHLMLRLAQEARDVLSNNKQRGIAIITMHVVMDANGSPLVWVVPKGKRVEPSKDAADIINGLVGVLDEI